MKNKIATILIVIVGLVVFVLAKSLSKKTFQSTLESDSGYSVEEFYNICITNTNIASEEDKIKTCDCISKVVDKKGLLNEKSIKKDIDQYKLDIR